jgi:hypothetical protein
MAPGVESEVMREYRHLLRTASADWQETAHRHALMAMGANGRREVLAEVQRLLLAGTRLCAEDIHAIARLLVLAERRRPRSILDGMRPDLVEALAAGVVRSPVGGMLRVGYDIWDGTEPPPPRSAPPPPDLHTAWTRTDFGTEVSMGDLGSASLPTRPPRPKP